MADITPELLRDISVQTVEGFLNNKVPLSVGLAKQAAAHDLNSEQIQRAVESTNNIAYLKVLQLSDDRTVEFPLAKFAEVMSFATIPDSFHEKIALLIGVEPQINTSIEKVASAYETTPLVDAEKYTYLIKSASANRAALERANVESINVAEALVKVAQSVSKDEKWMDKLACVTTAEDFSALSVLVSGAVQPYRDLKEFGLFKSAELKEVGKFAELYKQARALVREQRERLELQKRADDATQSIKSNVFSKAMDGATSAMKNTASVIGQAPGYVAGKAVGTVAGAPFRAAAGAMNAVKNKTTSSFRDSMSGGKSTVPASLDAVGETSKAIGRGAIKTISPVLDAAFYDPGKDSTTGRSNDVWSALQRD
jgi:hypothetical protein